MQQPLTSSKAVSFSFARFFSSSTRQGRGQGGREREAPREGRREREGGRVERREDGKERIRKGWRWEREKGKYQ